MTFLRLTAVEMRRALHRRVVRWMVLLAVISCAFAGVLVFLTSRDSAELLRTGEHPALMRTWWLGPGGGDSYLLTAALFLVMGAAICGASVAGGEWRAGTITTTLTWEPVRWRLHAARTTSAFVLSFVIALALQALFLLAAVPGVALNGNADGTDRDWWFALLLGALRIALATAFIATVAVSIATIGRNTSAALIVLAAWALVVERIIAGLRPQLARFMISENVAIVVPWAPLDGVEFERPPIVSLVSLTVYLAIIVALAFVSFSRRDIVAAT